MAQFPSKDKTIADEPNNPKVYDYQWKDSEVVLIDKNFNTLLDPRDRQVIQRFGSDSDNKRLFGINEITIQAIGSANMTLSAFAQDPTVYGYEQVVIWEGRFRNYAKVRKSTRAWTTTIRFGQPRILDEKGNDYKYHYPQSVLSEIQRRPNLPPSPIKPPLFKDAKQLLTYWYTYEDDSEPEVNEYNFRKFVFFRI